MLYTKDYKTEINKFGEAFCDFCRIWDSKEYDKYGELFLKLHEKLHIKPSLSKEAKMLKTGIVGSNCFTILVNMIQEYIDDNVSLNWTKLIVKRGEAYAKIYIFKNPDANDVRGFGYTVSDFLGTPEYKENNTFLYISSLVSCAPDDGKMLIKQIQRWCNVPILLEAGYLFNVDEHEDENFEYLDKLEEYYKNLGFENINDRVGCYDTKTAMLWMPTKSTLNLVIKEAKES